MSNAEKGSGFFAGFILGGIIGAFLGIFLSQKGSEGTFKSRLGDMVTQARETIREAVEEGKEAAQKKEAEIQGIAKAED